MQSNSFGGVHRPLVLDLSFGRNNVFCRQGEERLWLLCYSLYVVCHKCLREINLSMHLALLWAIKKTDSANTCVPRHVCRLGACRQRCPFDVLGAADGMDVSHGSKIMRSIPVAKSGVLRIYTVTNYCVTASAYEIQI